MGDDLRGTLQRALDQGADNAALDTIIGDYARYHLVLAIVGSLMVVGLASLTVWSWRGARRAPVRPGRRLSLERASLGLLSAGSAVTTLLLILVVAANVSTAAAPLTGFQGAVAGVRPAAGNHVAQVQADYAAWLNSGTAEVPADVSAWVDDRLAWQAPKAIVTSVLLVLAVAAGAWVLRRVRAVSRGAVAPSRARSLRLMSGLAAVSAVCGLLTLMVLGNTQAAVAPVAMTMFFG